MKKKIQATNARYSAKVEDLLNQLAPLGDDLLNKKPADGGWSAIQTLHHLILVEENSMAYIHKKLSFHPKLEKAGIRSMLQSFLLQISLWSPFKFKAPKAAAAERIPDSALLADTRARWERIRHEWTVFLENMPVDLSEKAVYNHPIAGRLSWIQMINFMRAHFERHRGQVLRAVS